MRLSFKKILNFKIAFIGIFIIFSLFAFNFFKEYNRNRELNKEIKNRLTACKRLYKKLGLGKFQDLTQKALKFLPAIITHFPRLMVEAQAIGIGAGVKFEELLVLMCEEELFDMDIPKCTSIALKNGRTVLIGHNEDWLNSYLHNGLYILKCKMGSHYSLSLNYIGSLPGSSSGMNANGLCFTANSLNAGRFRYGVPIKFQFRGILESPTLRDAAKADLRDSAIAGNTMYAWKSSRILDVEDYFGHHDKFYGKKFLIHTNHPILPEERSKKNTARESIRRYDRAKEIFAEEKKYDLQTLKKVLADHKAKICSHPRRHRAWGPTIASVIMNPKEKWMEVCWGNPCRNKYVRYSL